MQLRFPYWKLLVVLAVFSSSTSLYSQSANLNTSIVASTPCSTPDPSIIGWWSGDGQRLDYAGTNHLVWTSGETYSQGVIGRAFSFNNFRFLRGPDSDLWAFGSNDFSIELWANWRTFQNSPLGNPGTIFVANDEESGQFNKWLFALGGGVLNFHINSPASGPLFLCQGAFTPQINEWYHLAVTRSNFVFRIYTNGVLLSSQSNTTPVPNPNAPLTIGSAEGLGYLDGLMDEIIIYKRSLTGEEVAASFINNGAGKCRPVSITGFVRTTQQADITVATEKSLSYVVEKSTDLKNWTGIGSQSATNIEMKFIDMGQGTTNRGFYKARQN